MGEFTMADNMIEYGQFKIWKEGNFETVHFQYMTDFGVPQTFTMKRNSNFVQMNFGVRGNKEVRNEALMGVGAASSSRTVFKLNNQVNDHGILFSLNRDGLKYDYDFSYE